MDDLFLIKQVTSGNKEAFRFLVIRYQRPLFKFLNGFGIRSSSQDELAQETFLRAYKNLSSYSAEKGATFSTWLFTIAKNLALNEITRKSNQNEVLAESEADAADSRPLADSALVAGQDLTQVAQALEKLPTEFKNAVTLSYLKELSLQEIALMENCSLGTVKSRIFRGKQLLKILLQTRAEA